MKSKFSGLFALSIFSMVLVMGLMSAVNLATWDLTNDEVATNVNTNVNAVNLVFGSTLDNIGFGVDGATSTGWNLNALGNNDYYEIALSLNTGFSATINSISFNQISSDGTTDMSFDVEWSTDGFITSTNIGSAVVSTDSSTSFSDTSTIAVVEEGKTFSLRVFGYNSDSSSTETFSIKNLVLGGTVTAIPSIVPTEITTCSNLGNSGELEIKKIDITNLGMLQLRNTDPVYVKFGDDDEWFILDDIEVEIEIDNDGNEDVDDIVVEWGLYDTQAKEWVIEMDDEKDFNLKDGKDEILIINFNLEDDLDVDLEDLNDGNVYKFYVTATGVVDNSTADDTCVFDSEDIEIVIESDFVVLSNVNFPESVMCGETVQVTADVWSIGDNDQDDGDGVSVDLISKALGVDVIVPIGDIDAFDSEKLDFTFTVPNDAEEKFHAFTFRVLDEDDDVYENDYDDDESEFTLPLKVSGNCVSVTEDSASVSATLESEAKAGESLVVSVTITNTDDTTLTYDLNAAGFGEWATSAQLSQTSFTLNAEDSKVITFTFDVKKEASGEKTFDVEVFSGGEFIVAQPVSVSIEEAPVGFLRGITGNVIGEGRGYLWAIGAVNLILIVLIVVVAVRLSRKE